MDKDRLIGLTLISVLVILYTHFFAPKLPVAPTPSQDSRIDTATSAEQIGTVHVNQAATTAQYGIFAQARTGTEKEIVLENDVMKVTLSSKGGGIKAVVLKHYQDHQQQPLPLLDAKSSQMGLQFTYHDTTINTNTLFFETLDDTQCVKGTEVAKATFTLSVGPGQYLQQIFVLPGTGYELAYSWKMVGLASSLGNSTVNFVWENLLKRVEEDLKASRNKTTINYYLANHTFHSLKEGSDRKEEKTIPSPIKWISMKQRFFTAGIIAKEAFQGGYMATVPTPESTTTVKSAKVQLEIPVQRLQESPRNFSFYFGPNDYKLLKQVTKGFAENLSLGWPVVKWINQFVIMPIFTFLERHLLNYGVIIFLLVIIIKCLLLPLSYKSYLSMAKMKLLKPELDRLKAKYGSDLQKMQMEQISLYRNMGINPLSGCIPILLQMPILLAMFNFFPNAIALRQQPFLWAHDLSTYDAIIRLPFKLPVYGSHVSLFTLLMTASTILYTWSNNQTGTTQGPMKTVSYLMPLTFMLLLNTFPAGLSFYYFVSNLLTFGQQLLIRSFVDEAKVKEKLENKKKPRDSKKSRFQLRLEGAMQAAAKKRKSPKR